MTNWLLKAKELRKGRFGDQMQIFWCQVQRLLHPWKMCLSKKPRAWLASCGRGARFTAPSRHSVSVVFKVTQHLPLIRVPVTIEMVYYCEADKMVKPRLHLSPFPSHSPAKFCLLFSPLTWHNRPSATWHDGMFLKQGPLLAIIFGPLSLLLRAKTCWINLIQILFLILISSLIRNKLVIFPGPCLPLWNKG